jgi:excisionase family DNA binding protein
MNQVELLLESLRKDVMELKELFGRRGDLPHVLTPKLAARELSISVWTVREMMKAGELATCKVGKHKGIPRSEIERLATPPGPKVRPTTGRPKGQPYDAKEEAARARAAIAELKAARKR